MKICLKKKIKLFLLGMTCCAIWNINGTNVIQASAAKNQYEVYKTRYVWIYKMINNKRYRRLYDSDLKKWIGDWIPEDEE